ncbi:MAG TPA: geranylgeranyl reductase family protein [Dehalococcoidia bacterium]|nr:geranylgeranyl reductase family protein [Dehalococcoidia bacterium]
MTLTYDILVAGAGPAGSGVARRLAQAGARVALLDRATFPRDKPCGGGVTVRAAALAGDVDLAPVVERVVYGARVTTRLRRPFERRSPEPLTYMTQRRRLDHHLLQRAAEAGADVREGVTVRDGEVTERGVTLRANGDVYTGAVLVAADGANGVAARIAGLDPVGQYAVALEGNLPADDALLEQWRDTIALDLGGTPGGYGWIFPKGDHLNVGVGGWRWIAATLRDRLEALCAAYGLDPAALRDLRGHRLPMRRDGAPLVRGRALAVGDAAGLIDPLSGEGIQHAFESAALAADAIERFLRGETADLASYDAAVEAQIMPDLRTSRKLMAVFHRIPDACVAVMRRSDRFWGALCRIVRGEQTYAGFREALGPLRLALDLWGEWGARRDQRRG